MNTANQNKETVKSVVPGDVAQIARNRISKSEDALNLKVAINNFLWSELPMNTTIHRAEILACKILGMILDER